METAAFTYYGNETSLPSELIYIFTRNYPIQDPEDSSPKTQREYVRQ